MFSSSEMRPGPRGVSSQRAPCLGAGDWDIRSNERCEPAEMSGGILRCEGEHGHPQSPADDLSDISDGHSLGSQSRMTRHWESLPARFRRRDLEFLLSGRWMVHLGPPPLRLQPSMRVAPIRLLVVLLLPMDERSFVTPL